MEKSQPHFDKVFVDFCVASMVPDGPDYGLLDEQAIGVTDGKIVWIGENADDFLSTLPSSIDVITGGGKLLTPGLIDCHTHLVHGGNRADEWEARLGGKSYEEIARAGGGILSTVRHTRESSLDELVETAAKRLSRLMAEGVTTVEIKSGYGLDVESELKMLRAAKRLGEQFNVRVEATFLGAHAVPPEYKGRADDYLDLVCQEMIPAAADLCSAVDVFCESIAFDLKQTERVFRTALEHGLQIKVHAEQLSNLGAARMAAEMGALSADHLEYLSEEDCRKISGSSMVATLLPGAFYCLKEKQKPPVTSLIENEIPIAIATDCNPGSSPVTSLLLMGNMATNLFGMTPELALAGMTRNAAMALGLQDQLGTIQVGKQADFAVWDVWSPSEILYEIGGNTCVEVYRNGEKV